jgi:patatin-like phospholipase/acyl hydrolase
MADHAVSTNPPRRLLAIDGGGLAGLIPAEALIGIEQQLNRITGTEKRLCDRFDLIGGSSTGGILAAGLALGLKATELRDF